MTADKTRAARPTLAPNDHDDYRALLEESQRGLDSARAFIHSIRSSAAAASNDELRTNAETTQALIDRAIAHLDQVWDEFQRIYYKR